MADGVIEAIHIYDERHSPILSHTYTSRPLSSTHLLPLYLSSHPDEPRPNLTYLPNTNPPTLVFSLVHANLLYLATASSEVEPLLVLEFLHRVIDALEDFLGAPLISHKIEANYDVVAQLLTEMCDGGTVATTEPNALRDVVEVEGWMGKLLGSITLPGQVKDLGSAYGRSPSPATAPSLIQNTAPALPWRRSNVRHTSNELYADVVETLNVTLAPSGRPLAAFANGTIAFTSKVSGVPDINLTLTSPTGKHNLASLIELPVFHPCVRLARWKEQPGVLSFIPPDGRFILAGYEVDLLPFTNEKSANLSWSSLKLPANIEMKTGLGPTGSDFEVKVHVNRLFGAVGGSGGMAGYGRGGSSVGGRSGTPSSSTMEDVVITVPLPEDVRNLPEIRPTRGDATYSPGDRQLQWHIPTKELSAGTTYFGLRCTVTGSLSEEDENALVKDYTYEEPYQVEPTTAAAKLDKAAGRETAEERDTKRVAQNKILMPSSASISFSVKGWLPSGIKVESILVDTRKSRGIGEGLKPYKGVKYLTVSKGGVEIRC